MYHIEYTIDLNVRNAFNVPFRGSLLVTSFDSRIVVCDKFWKDAEKHLDDWESVTLRMYLIEDKECSFLDTQYLQPAPVKTTLDMMRQSIEVCLNSMLSDFLDMKSDSNSE